MARGGIGIMPDNLNEVITHPFTGLYWDFQTKSYMFFICGTLVVQLDPNGSILYAVEKEVVRG